MVIIYLAKPGDTLYSISRRYGLPVEVLARFNRIKEPDKLNIGQQIRIPVGPTPNYYTVRSGDTLFILSNRFGTTVEKLAEMNEIADPSMIYPGQRLKIK